MLCKYAKRERHHRSGFPTRRRFAMRTIYLLAMCLWLNACTTTLLFPPESTKDLTNDTAVITAWKDQASYTSGVNSTSTKVQLGGRITEIIPKPGGVIILAEEQPMDRYLGYGPTSAERKEAFRFAIIFSGFPDDDMLKVGNPLAVVGEMAGPRPESNSSTPSVVLPHLLAQCLHIWKSEQIETDMFPYEGTMGYYPLESRTFCRKEDNGKNLSTANDRRFHAPRATGQWQRIDHGVSAHGLPAMSERQDISLGKH